MTNSVNNRSLLPWPEIVQRYLGGESGKGLASAAGISPTAIRYGLMRRGITPRGIKEAMKICPQRKDVQAPRKLDWDTIIAEYLVDMIPPSQLAKRHNVTCSSIMYILTKSGVQLRQRAAAKGPDHPMWSGGVHETTDHYLSDISGRRLHRTTVEQDIGRSLNHWEDVHHLDGNRQNLNLNNLVIIPRREHARFHTFLRHRNIKTNPAISFELCRMDGELWRFTTLDMRAALQEYPLRGRSHLGGRRKRGMCKIPGCEKQSCNHGLCSKHWQRHKAAERGFWQSGHGRTSRFRMENSEGA